MASSQQGRRTRTAQTRDEGTRPATYRPPSYLEAPPPPAGYKYHWVRHSLRGVPDDQNISTYFYDGWRPVPLSEIPEEWRAKMPAIDGRRFESNGKVVGIGDLVLMINTEEHVNARAAYYRAQAERAVPAALEEYQREERAGMPLTVERKSSTTGARRVPFGEES